MQLTPTFALFASDFRVRFADFWRVTRVQINFGQIPEVTGAYSVPPLEARKGRILNVGL